MKKRFILGAPSLVLIALLFPLLSANKLEKTSTVLPVDDYATVMPVNKEKDLSPLYRKKLSLEIQEYFEKAVKRGQIVGAAVGVVKCDSTILLEGYGRKDAYREASVSKNTIFRIGSVSKGFAGILAGIQVEKGNLNWKDKVISYVPDFKMASKNATDSITLSHLLSHSSGLPYHSFTNLVEEGQSLNQIAPQFEQIPLMANPGQVYSYQNAAFALSGSMISKVLQEDYETALSKYIFKPLDMATASTDYASLMTAADIAMPHKRRGRGWRPVKINQKYFNAVAAGGVNASITDMSKWMRFLLGHNQEVMSAAGLKEVFTPQVSIPGRVKYYQKWNNHKSSWYARGWRIHNFEDRQSGKNETILHHGGHVNSYRSEIAIYPDRDLGICVLFNSPTKLAKNVIPDLQGIIEDVFNTPSNIIEEEFVNENDLIL